jgi:hypothetical protein
MRYLVATVGGWVFCACGLFVGGRVGVLDTPLFPPALLFLSAAVVIVVSRPWFAEDGRTRPIWRLATAWLAAIGCVILVLVVGGIGGFLYACSKTVCMP